MWMLVYQVEGGLINRWGCYLTDSRYKQNQAVSLFCDRLSTHLPQYSHWNSKGVKCVFTYKTCFVLRNLASLCLQLQELWTLFNTSSMSLLWRDAFGIHFVAKDLVVVDWPRDRYLVQNRHMAWESKESLFWECELKCTDTVSTVPWIWRTGKEPSSGSWGFRSCVNRSPL